jgi:PKD repeat protein
MKIKHLALMVMIVAYSVFVNAGDIRVYDPVTGVGDGTENFETVLSMDDYVDMTPATTAHGTDYILSGSFSGGDKLFDNDQASRWIVDAKSGWAVYDFGPGNAKAVNAYGLLQSNNYGYGTRSPRTFNLYGSNDESYSLANGNTMAEWTLLDSRSSSSYFGTSGNSLDDIRIFKTSNMRAYRYYMFEIVANNGDQYTVLGELEFYELYGAGSLIVDGVPDKYGIPTPAYGTHADMGGINVTFTAPAEGTNTAQTLMWSCTGYKVYTIDSEGTWEEIDSGSIEPGESVDYICTETSQTKWVWDFEVKARVEAEAPENGIVEGSGWYVVGDTAVLTATTVESGIAFSHWSGDIAADATRGDNPLRFTVASPTVVTANFRPVIHVATTGDDANPGDADYPKASIQAAVDALGSEGGIVTVAAGTYADLWEYDISRADSNSVVVVTTPVRIVGATGNPADVVVTRTAEQQKRIFYLGNPLASISYLTVSNGFNNLSTLRHGGNIFINSDGGTVSDCIVANGRANSDYSAHGGNIYMSAGTVARCIIEKGTSADNEWGGKGSAVHMTGGVLENCLIRNQISGRTAVWTSGSSIVANCTLVGNRAAAKESNAGINADNNAKVVNCVIIGNTAGCGSIAKNNVWRGNAANFVNCLADAEINSSCIYQSGVSGFAVPAEGDFRLTPTSAALDAGADYETSGATSTTDLDRNLRVAGNGVDIGCYELQLDEMIVAFDADTVTGINPMTVVFTASVAGVPPGQIIYSWDFDNDGTVDLVTDEASCSHTYLNPSTNSVKLTVSAGTGSASLIQMNYINVSPNTMYVRAGNENAEYPYTSWDIAAATVEAAVDIAATGTRIIVSNGVYEISKNIEMSQGVHVEGVTGNPNDIVFNLNSKNYRMNDPAAVLSSVKLTGGSATQGGAVWIGLLGGTLTNCIVENSRSTGYDGRAGGVYASGDFALVSHCIVSNCTTSSEGEYESYKAAGVQMDGGRIESSLVVGCYSTTQQSNFRKSVGGILVASGASAVNCTVVGCSGHRAGGIYSSGAVTNCAIVGCANMSESFPVPVDAWDGAAAGFVNCLTDTDDPINGTCFVTDLPETRIFRTKYGTSFFPATGSPLVDRGANWHGVEKATDLAGNPRKVGSRVDIGCYEGPPENTIFLIR